MSDSEAMDELTLVVAAARPLTRDLFLRALDSLEKVRVVGQAANADGARDLVAHLQPRAALLFADAASAASPADEIRAVKDVGPRCGVVVLTDEFDAGTAEMLASLPWGGWGYLPSTSVEDAFALVRALRAAADGLVILDRRAANPDGAVRQLTRRQQEVLALMARGLSNPAIARELVLEEKSVENHINAIFNQLGVSHDPSGHPRVRAVLTYLRLARPSPTTGVGDASSGQREASGRPALSSRA